MDESKKMFIYFINIDMKGAPCTLGGERETIALLQL